MRTSWVRQPPASLGGCHGNICIPGILSVVRTGKKKKKTHGGVKGCEILCLLQNRAAALTQRGFLWREAAPELRLLYFAAANENALAQTRGASFVADLSRAVTGE